MLVFVLAVSIALVCSFLCSISEAVLLSIGHADVESMRGTRGGEILRRFKRDIDAPIAAILIVNTVAHTVGSTVAGASYSRVFAPDTLWVFSAIFTVAVLVLTEILPKTIGVTFARRLGPAVAIGVAASVILLKPILAVTRHISSWLTRDHAKPVTSLEEISLLASLGHSDGVIGPKAAGIIEGAARLRQLTVREVMVPREAIVALSGAESVAANLERVRRSGHSRLPFSPDGDLDRIEGVVLVKDLLYALRDGEAIDWAALIRPLVVLPDTTALSAALRRFQEEHRHLGIVVDEYGGTSGIVTLEDVLEQLVGEIRDETDRVGHLVRRDDEGALLCRAWAPLGRVLAAQGLDPSSVAPGTVGGFVADELGRVPVTGDRLRWRDLEFEVQRASPRRAELVRVRRAEDGPTAQDD